MKFLNLIQIVCDRSSAYHYSRPAESMAASQEIIQLNEYQELSKIDPDKISKDQKQRLKELLVQDAALFALETIRTYLKKQHPEARLTNDGKRAKIDNMSHFTDREKVILMQVLAEINSDIDLFSKDRDSSLNRFQYSFSFLFKDLLQGHDKYMALEESGLIEFKKLISFLESIGLPETDSQLKFAKEQYKHGLEQRSKAFQPENFISFCSEVLTYSGRMGKLEKYDLEIKELTKEALEEANEPINIFVRTYQPGQWIDGDSITMRCFCVNTTEDEFKSLKEALKEKSPRERNRLTDIRTPTENSIKNSIQPSYSRAKSFPYDTPEKYDPEVFLVSRRDRKDYKLSAGVVFLDASLKPTKLDREDSDILNTLNTFFYAYGKTGKIKLFVSDVYRELHTSTPNAKALEKLERRISELSSYWSQRILELKNLITGEVRVLSPQNLKNLDYFLNLPNLGYTPSSDELLWAIKRQRILKIDGLGPDENKNGTISKSFILEEQPIMNKLAEDHHQVITCPSSILKHTGKNNQMRAIREAILQYLAKPYRKAEKVIKIPSFLHNAGVIATEAEYKDDRDRKRNLNDCLEEILSLFCVEGKIDDYILVIEADLLVIHEALKLNSKMSIERKNKAYKKFKEHKKEKKEALQKELGKLSRKSFIQKTGLKGSEVPTEKTPKYQKSKCQKTKKDVKGNANPVMVGWVIRGKIGPRNEEK